ncbi:Flagellar protein FlaG protein [Pseudomonas sp. 8AS]|uniref:flagellar protein FlaG n=1 Tax=Pseudomonas sp. 8AS TaxID=2653163 RepID=UPI0012F44E3D|nr:flagellar protein FlaG [Pseudomonas sp. 8AS]VXB91513.1 Flagellar protein FlaG protein [Pseudomonas sp. 8AS]
MEVGSVKNSSSGGVLHLPSVENERPAVAAQAEAEQVEAEQPVPSRGQVEHAVSSIQDFVQSVRRNLNFQVDDSSGRVVVKVTDSQSGDVIRQMPTEEALKLAESLDEVRSLLFRAEA